MRIPRKLAAATAAVSLLAPAAVAQADHNANHAGAPGQACKSFKAQKKAAQQMPKGEARQAAIKAANQARKACIRTAVAARQAAHG